MPLKTSLIKSQFHIIVSILQEKKQDFKVENIHELRVELKKLNLLLSIIKDSGNRLKDKKQLNHLKQIFKQAGKIRELQLVILQLNFWKEKYSISKLISIKNVELKQSKLAFFELNKVSIHYKHIEQEIISQLEKSKKNISFLQKIQSEINNTFEEITKMKLEKEEQIDKKELALHKLRVNTKKLVNYFKFFNEVKKENHIDKLVEINNQLGEWHDLVVLKFQVLEYIQNNPKTKKQTVDAASIIWENQQKINAFEKLILVKIHSIKQV
ncbi:MAG: CHAD domain-containing protein [Sphingobacteriales bacterium]|nr:CHAD domain-containing protein [Sphingobacteriales bacterium]